MLAPIYAVDSHGLCHVFEKDEETVHEEKILPSTAINSSLESTIKDQSENFFHANLTEFFSTQPFSILDFNEEKISSLQLFNDNLLTTPMTKLMSPPSPLSGRVSTPVSNDFLIPRKKKPIKKRNKKSRIVAYRFALLKKQWKNYLKKKEKKCDEPDPTATSSIQIQSQSMQIETVSIDHSSMIDLQLTPDLSKRNYVYRDITLTNQNSNQINWKLFQSTQPTSSLAYLSQSTNNDHISRPFHFLDRSISLPDIRIGLSRYRNSKQLHKTSIN